jgi:hypothetical protein
MRLLYGRQHHGHNSPWDDAPPWAIELREMAIIILMKQDILMSLAPEVQNLVDALVAQGEAITASNAELVVLEGQVVSLSDQLAKALADHSAGNAISAEDLAAIVASTGTITASIANIKAAMPQPVAAATVAAVADAPAADAPTA